MMKRSTVYRVSTGELQLHEGNLHIWVRNHEAPEVERFFENLTEATEYFQSFTLDKDSARKMLDNYTAEKGYFARLESWDREDGYDYYRDCLDFLAYTSDDMRHMLGQQKIYPTAELSRVIKE